MPVREGGMRMTAYLLLVALIVYVAVAGGR